MKFEVIAQIDTPWGLEPYIYKEPVDTIEDAEILLQEAKNKSGLGINWYINQLEEI